MERHDSKKVRHSMSMSFKGGRRQEIILNYLKTYNYSSVDIPGNYWELGTAFLQLSADDRKFKIVKLNILSYAYPPKFDVIAIPTGRMRQPANIEVDDSTLKKD